ncbi:F0F1 ATP synthase subunit B [Campylobacter geochelonis]|uniref:ATP synthase subunit b n=1 Tax=Campylobacter geochelonis TaxID=1780362 RepID=A0A128ENV4_9BACT|nr:F0F1 ATP synthase subunit B [Campylobacter geochelonis]QKF70695.1 ATP synthase, F0 complex, b subunit [Campylobacter geochelonis]CZE45770.1 F0F1 ATP synthase subunit B [Campylobacter geochelonis]CZE46873.1 F0F1 ATP synthase subunit B [Campylobacter geochelonis]CZE50260.1 F0F1 ATP synthase subunit B [Campylobacter geochelonis]
MKKLFFMLLAVIPCVVFASVSDGPKDYDIVPRTVNFLIFFGILFYFLKGPIKNAYNNRINSIAARLEENQAKLKESKDKKEQAVKELELAKTRAVSLIEVARKEIELTKTKIEESTKDEIEHLKRNYDNKKDFESKKITKSVVSEILDETFADESIKLSQNELVDVIHKKVG